MSSTTAIAESNPLTFLTENPISSALSSLHASFRERRQALGLKNPGTVENLSREVLKDVFLNNHTFSGMRADLMKSFSMNPVFQISHAFTMGAQGLPPYTFAAVFGNDKVGLNPAHGWLAGTTDTATRAEKGMGYRRHSYKLSQSCCKWYLMLISHCRLSCKQVLIMMVKCRAGLTTDGFLVLFPR